MVSRFKAKSIQMIKDINGRIDDYSISPKDRQILLHWIYELVESDLLWSFFFFWDNSTSSQDSNCDDVVLEICLDHKF